MRTTANSLFGPPFSAPFYRAWWMAGALLLTACSSEPAAETPSGEPPSSPATEATAEVPAPSDVWWEALSALCGQAFAGQLVSTDAADAELAGQPMVMHVRRCAEDRLEIPFHIGENRSRTWVLTRTPEDIQLQHDHRHEDGSEDEVTLYGGATDPADRLGDSAQVQHFPADRYSIELFETHGLEASVANVWSMEVVPGERFSYILRRPERHFQADFDLGQPVEPPPTPWGHG